MHSLGHVALDLSRQTKTNRLGDFALVLELHSFMSTKSNDKIHLKLSLKYTNRACIAELAHYTRRMPRITLYENPESSMHNSRVCKCFTEPSLINFIVYASCLMQAPPTTAKSCIGVVLITTAHAHNYIPVTLQGELRQDLEISIINKNSYIWHC